MVNIHLLNDLLNNYITAVDGIEATVLITKDGAVITSIIGKEMAEEDIGGIAHLIRYITDILVFDSSFKFEKTSKEISTQQHQFLFRQIRPNIMFVSICKETANIKLIKAYCEYCAQKIEQIIDNRDVIPEIPTMKIKEKKPLKEEYVFKICVIGNAGVGKTTSITQFSEARFESDYKPTIGTSIVKKDATIDNALVHFQIWDIAGQDIWQRMRKIYYAGAEGALVLFDVTRPSTFTAVEKWLDEFKTYSGPNKKIILVGNKVDLVEKRKITYDEAKKLAEKLELPYFEASARTKENVDAIFLSLASKLISSENEK
ncbi:MAG: GTP-binding protein [Candidatus Helarchaeota archaeon]